MTASEFLQRELHEIADGVRNKAVTAIDLLDAQCAAIDRLDPQHHVYITHTRERARAQANAIDSAVARGEEVGPLAGVPIAVKDIYDMKGAPTTAAMIIHRDSIAEHDATVIQRLERAGAVIVGKLTLTEGVYAEHRESFPVPVNAWHDDYWPGASSSGSGIAVAAGLACAALGSETGGSIKLPAAANGNTAMKPTWGRVSRAGVFELAANLDHVGPFARSVTDAALMLEVIAGPDDNDPTAAVGHKTDFTAALDRGIEGIKIGLDSTWLSSCVDSETLNALERAVGVLGDSGARIEAVSVPDVTEMIWDWFPVCAAQTALAHKDTFPSQRDAYGPALAQLLDMGNNMSATEYQQVLHRRDAFRGRLAAMFASVDLIALPVLAFPVPSLQRMADIDDDLIAGLHRFTCPFNLSGSPGLVLPCGFNDAGLPIVFQLVGRHFEEHLLVAAGAAYQAKTDWHLRRPSRA